MKNRVMSVGLPVSEKKLGHRFTRMNTDSVFADSSCRVICVNLWQKIACQLHHFTVYPWRNASASDYEIIPVNKFIVIHVAEHRFNLR